MCSSDLYLAQIDELKEPADLKNATLVRSALEPWQPWFEAAGLDWPEPTTGIRVDDLGLLQEMVRHGHGVGLAREHFARELLAAGELVRVFDVQIPAPPHAYYAVYEKAVLDRPEVLAFLNWMKQVFKVP